LGLLRLGLLHMVGMAAPRRYGHRGGRALGRVGLVRMVRMVRSIVPLVVDQAVDARDILLLCRRRTTSCCGGDVLLLGGVFRHWLLLARNSGTLVIYGSG
jgi:hypothetical protein